MGCVRTPDDRCICGECSMKNIQAVFPKLTAQWLGIATEKHADCMCDWCAKQEPSKRVDVTPMEAYYLCPLNHK